MPVTAAATRRAGAACQDTVALAPVTRTTAATVDAGGGRGATVNQATTPDDDACVGEYPVVGQLLFLARRRSHEGG